MNRRGFIGTLLAAATLDPERLLWVPGKKLISIPPPPVTFWPALIRVPHIIRPGGAFSFESALGIGRGGNMCISSAIACEYPRRDVKEQTFRVTNRHTVSDRYFHYEFPRRPGEHFSGRTATAS